MSLTSLGFLAFLVASLIIYSLGIIRPKLKPWLIGIFNLLFYYSFGLNNVIILVIFAFITFLAAVLIRSAKPLTHTLKKYILITSVFLIVVFLLTFKLYSPISELVISQNYSSLDSLLKWNLVMPLGVSFYCFRAISYLVDTVEGRLQKSHSFLDYWCFVSFFPHIIAGPLMKASVFFEDLDSQNYKPDSNLITLLFISGLFKKLVISSFLYQFLQSPFQIPENYASSDLIFAIFLYYAYIYTDFSGYSDLANATAHIFGFSITPNFAGPYGARSFNEFWRRWHISLSRWFRDYIYIPLGGDGRMSKHPALKKATNTMIVMLVSGLWHGTGWGFILWGALHGLGMITGDRMKKMITQISIHQKYSPLLAFFGWLTTFVSISFLWVFFATDTLQNAGVFLIQIVKGNRSAAPDMITNPLLWFILILVVTANILYSQLSNAFYQGFSKAHLPIRVLIITLLIYVIAITKPSIVPPYVYQSF